MIWTATYTGTYLKQYYMYFRLHFLCLNPNLGGVDDTWNFEHIT
jgi:hypothetical protein